MKNYKDIISMLEESNVPIRVSSVVGSNIRTAKTVSVKDKIILKKLLDNRDDLNLDYHLPPEVLNLDKQGLLLLIYRLLPLLKD